MLVLSFEGCERKIWRKIKISLAQRTDMLLLHYYNIIVPFTHIKKIKNLIVWIVLYGSFKCYTIFRENALHLSSNFNCDGRLCGWYKDDCLLLMLPEAICLSYSAHMLRISSRRAVSASFCSSSFILSWYAWNKIGVLIWIILILSRKILFLWLNALILETPGSNWQ